ncbi:hypothetical protein WCE39_09195 [Luteimonas sp. MJ174]|uniref:hypothetical protein n=1 Tax=Luteimonas sp. MJ174 TaxID=3129237 RepID=UPI0031BACA9C
MTRMPPVSGGPGMMRNGSGVSGREGRHRQLGRLRTCLAWRVLRQAQDLADQAVPGMTGSVDALAGMRRPVDALARVAGMDMPGTTLARTVRISDAGQALTGMAMADLAGATLSGMAVAAIPAGAGAVRAPSRMAAESQRKAAAAMAAMGCGVVVQPAQAVRARREAGAFAQRGVQRVDGKDGHRAPHAG